MTTSVSTPAIRYVRTGCNAAEILWPMAQAERFRALTIAAAGRDCVHEPGKACPLTTTR